LEVLRMWKVLLTLMARFSWSKPALKSEPSKGLESELGTEQALPGEKNVWLIKRSHTTDSL